MIFVILCVINIVMGIVNMTQADSGYRLGWFCSVLGWGCALLLKLEILEVIK